MAVRMLGEASFTLDGASYTVRFDAEALCQIEDQADRSIGDVLAELGSGKSPKISLARTVLWGGLRYHHPEVTPSEAAEMLFLDGAAVSGAMNTALTAAFPQAKTKGENPPKKGRAAAGTGTNS